MAVNLKGKKFTGNKSGEFGPKKALPIFSAPENSGQVTDSTESGTPHIPSKNKKAGRSPAARSTKIGIKGQGHPPHAKPKSQLRSLTQSGPGVQPSRMGAAANTSSVTGGDDEQNENEGGPCIDNTAEEIAEQGSMADAIALVRNKVKGKRKYDPGTNTYRMVNDKRIAQDPTTYSESD